jgi:hypothetical protein
MSSPQAQSQPQTDLASSAPSAARLLAAWEDGTARSPARRALLLLAAAHPELAPSTLGSLPVGRRDARLLQLRARLFGPRLDSTASCPACGELLEFSLPIEQILPPDSAQIALEPSPPIRVEIEDHHLEARPPTADDLAALESLPDTTQAELELLRRCLLSARIAEAELDPTRLPPPVLAALSTRLSEADPLADLRLGLSCPSCRHTWSATFDISSYLWRELDVWARRLLHEIHTLAQTYGWTEDTILALSPARRRHYLELINA